MTGAVSVPWHSLQGQGPYFFMIWTSMTALAGISLNSSLRSSPISGRNAPQQGQVRSSLLKAWTISLRSRLSGNGFLPAFLRSCWPTSTVGGFRLGASQKVSASLKRRSCLESSFWCFSLFGPKIRRCSAAYFSCSATSFS